MRALTLVGALVFVTVAFAQTLAPRPVATAADLMEHIVVPSSTAVFRTSSELPKTDVEWKSLRAQALILAESGNLLMLRAEAKDKAGWMENAVLLRDASEKFIAAMEKRDEDAMSETGEEIYLACEQCHEKHLPRR